MNNVPNLDAMDADQLMAFWLRHQSGRKSRELFPESIAGVRRATADLANYASNTATARRLRLNGDIETALMYERIADTIYTRLPQWAQW